ncbi:hypothetical protein VTP01DRAFT_3843 [Rhizomucor pusillus]|uniref:uncharacterized protein n=1 Tax=Rhizomucor pusillus TaxID=4840 RepID=UPI0037432562
MRALRSNEIHCISSGPFLLSQCYDGRKMSRVKTTALVILYEVPIENIIDRNAWSLLAPSSHCKRLSTVGSVALAYQSSSTCKSGACTCSLLSLGFELCSGFIESVHKYRPFVDLMCHQCLEPDSETILLLQNRVAAKRELNQAVERVSRHPMLQHISIKLSTELRVIMLLKTVCPEVYEIDGSFSSAAGTKSEGSKSSTP